ncbi:hypothetical protein GQ600_11279 [Phytophthora cactorum]|nr:hypothetical protein GQ600_11279 [Phytophthora cactorum]
MIDELLAEGTEATPEIAWQNLRIECSAIVDGEGGTALVPADDGRALVVQDAVLCDSTRFDSSNVLRAMEKAVNNPDVSLNRPTWPPLRKESPCQDKGVVNARAIRNISGCRTWLSDLESIGRRLEPGVQEAEEGHGEEQEDAGEDCESAAEEVY